MRLALFNFRQTVDYRLEILSGLTVAMALIPEAVAFAFIAGLSPLTGLYAAFVVGLVASVLGGRPGMISGATGAIAVVLAELALSHGPEYIFATVILAGLLQGAAGFMRLGKLMRLVPQPVIFGLVTVLGIDTKTVGDLASIQGGFPPFHIPDIPWTLETLLLIAPYAAIVAGVGLVESLLTLNIIDEITETRGQGDRECVAQGAANVLSGLFSGMGGCAMIGQSLINVSSGARARLSGIVASVMLLVFILFCAPLIEKLPMAALTGLMIMVAIGTFEWASLRTFRRMPTSDVIIMVLVTGITAVLHNLALAVLIGVIVAALVFAWDNAIRIRARKHIDNQGWKVYELYGPLFFGSTTVFADKFDVQGDPEHVVLDFAESRVSDMSAIEAVNKVTARYAAAGKTVHLRHLSTDCRRLLDRAEAIIEVNHYEDPTYKVVTDQTR